MNQTSNQLLTNIFSVLSKIERNTSTPTNKTSSVASGVTRGGTNIFNNSNSPNNSTKPPSLGASIMMIPIINKYTKGFSANKDASAYLKFVDTLVKINEKASTSTDISAASNLLKGVFSSDTNIEKNIKSFVKLEQSGVLGVAASGLANFINSLTKVSKSINKSDMANMTKMSAYIAKPLQAISSALLDFGKSILLFSSTFLVAGSILGFGASTLLFAGTLIGISTTLVAFASTMSIIGKMESHTKKGSNVISGIGTSLLGFTASLVLMGGSILLLNAITGNPLTTAGAFIGGFLMVAGGLMVLAGSMSLIGSFAPLTQQGTSSLKSMGVGILALSATLVVAGGLMYGATFLSLGEHTSTPIVIGLSVLAMAGVFGIIGTLSPMIKKGSSTVMLMSMSILGFGASLAISALMFQKVFDTSKGWGDTIAGAVGILAVVGGIAGMALLYSSVIAPVSPLIAVASLSVMAMAGSILLMTYTMKKTIDATSNIPEGFGSSLTTAISGFVGGIWNGFKQGLGIGEASTASAIKGAAKVVAIGASSTLLMGMSASMIVFAKALSYFRSNGKIQIYERDANGEFIGKDIVDTVQASKSIGVAISSFLIEVSKAAEIVDEAKMQKVSQSLLGSSSASFLGLKIKPKPGLLDATIKFADMLNKFAGGKDIFRIYDEKSGKYSTVSVVSVSKNIADSILSFFTTIVNGVSQLDDSSNYDKVEKMAETLLGKSGMLTFGWKGFKREGAKIGILEPVLKFGEIVKLLGSGKYRNERGEEVEMNLDGAAIAQKIVNFSDSLMSGLSAANIDDTAMSSEGFAKFTSFIDSIGGKTEVIDKIASSIDRMAEATSKLVDSIANLNDSKLAALTSGNIPNNHQGISNNTTHNTQSNSSTPKSFSHQMVVDSSDEIATKVLSALSSRTFTFEFINNNGGKLVLR